MASAWCNVCRSEPQMPHAFTAMSASPAASTGSRTSSTTIWPFRAIAARMVAACGAFGSSVKCDEHERPDQKRRPTI